MAYCIVINRPMSHPCCPIPKLNCSWQHAKTNDCCYSESFANSEYSVNDLADLTGNSELSGKEIMAMKSELMQQVKISLK